MQFMRMLILCLVAVDASERGRNEKPNEGQLPDSQRQRVVYHLKKPKFNLLASNAVPAVDKIQFNHFQRYDDVKAKEEKRPTINDLANQRNVGQKLSGWKLHHLCQHLSQVVRKDPQPSAQAFNFV